MYHMTIIYVYPFLVNDPAKQIDFPETYFTRVYELIIEILGMYHML